MVPDSVRKAARVRRERGLRDGPYATLTVDVPCSFANDGRGGVHSIALTLANSGQFVRLTCTCECGNRGAGMALHRLGVAGTCGYALGLVKRHLLGDPQVDGDVWQAFSVSARAFIGASAQLSKSRREAHRTFVGRDAERANTRALKSRGRVLSALFKKRMGFTRTSFDVSAGITLDDDGYPTAAFVASEKVAYRAPGVAGWRLYQQGVAATYDLLASTRSGCCVCAVHGKRPSAQEKRGWRNKGHKNKHVHSQKHRDTYELALLEVLSSLPGVGGSE